MRASTTPRDGDARPLDGRHLSDDELSRYLDDDLAPNEREQAVDHLAACDQCRSVLADLQLLTATLGDLPQVDVPRSFQLDPSFGRAKESTWSRWGGMLMPLLPAMRAGTLALALALGGVTAFRVLEDQPTPESVQEQAGSLVQPTNTDFAAVQSTVAPVPTSTPVPAPENPSLKTDGQNDRSSEAAAGAPAGGEADAVAPADATSADEEADSATQNQPSASDRSADDGRDTADTAGSDDASVMIAMEAASPVASPSAAATATATATATALPTATPMPTATATQSAEVSVDGADRPWLGWLQVALGALLVGLGTLVIGVTRLRRAGH